MSSSASMRTATATATATTTPHSAIQSSRQPHSPCRRRTVAASLSLSTATTYLFSLWTIATLLCHITVVSSKRSVNRHIKILNDTGGKVQVFWVHPQTRIPSLMSDPDVVPGAEFPLESFVGHEFELRESSGACVQEQSGGSSGGTDETAATCRHVYFTVSENDDQSATLTKDFAVEFVDNKIKAGLEAADLIANCKAVAETRLQQQQQQQQGSSSGGDSSSSSSDTIMNDMLTCVQGGVATALERVNEEIAFQASIRKDIAATLENYTCVDDGLNSTADIGNPTTWRQDNVLHTVHTKLDRPASRIHLVKSFIHDDECQAMEDQAAATLHHATVADGKGGSRVSENRKAMQAGITVPWNTPDHPIARLSRRVYDYTNHVLGLDISHEGQEDLMSIQYFGRGRNDTEPDRYTPHCDGDCTGAAHKTGTRMATMVMYCQTAQAGGHTNFRNSGVHVKPESHDAIFFSYIDPETKIMDAGFTEHSGCPVFEGHKKIVTQWIRLGVSTEEPWTAFNTLGIKKSELEGLESS